MQTRFFFTLFLVFTSYLMSEERTIMHEGVEREFLVHIPDNLTEDSPIVFVIHGYTDSATQIMEYSGMNEVADREGFIVVYPQGTIDSQGNTFFNVGYEFHKDSTIDDVSFIRDLFVSLSEEYSLKRKQGFATGMSNGGDMSYLLACTSADLFRAVAPGLDLLWQRLKRHVIHNLQFPFLKYMERTIKLHYLMEIWKIMEVGEPITIYHPQ